MSYPDVYTSGPGTPPGLTLGDCLHRGPAPGACPHPDEQPDPGTETAA